MLAALRPAVSVKFVLFAAGVLLGLLAIAVMTGAFSAGGHGGVTDAAKISYFSGKMRPLGVIWR